MTTTKDKKKYKRAVIQVAMTGDDGPEPVDVKADVSGDWSIHREVLGKPWTDQNGDYHDGLGFSWTVTHVPTGFMVWNFDHKRQARHFVEGIPGLKLPKLGNTFGSDTSRNWSESQRNRYHKETARLIKESEGK